MRYQDKKKRFMLFKIATASFVLLLIILVSFLLADTIEQRQQNEFLSKKIIVVFVVWTILGVYGLFSLISKFL